MAAPLQNLRVPDVQQLRQHARDQLSDLLDSLPGKKDLVLEGILMKPLDRIAGAILLKEHGVDKIFKFEQSKSMQGNDQRIYLVRPNLTTMKYIADHVNSDQMSGISRKYKILMVPRKLHACELILEQEGVYGFVSLDDFPLDLIPLDDDILSLEMPMFFKDYFLDGDQTVIHTISRSLVKLQQTFGRIPNLYGIGKCSKMCHELTDLMFEMEGEPTQLHSQIGHMFLIDRDADLVTPLCSQVVYEGLLDDTFGIQSGFIDFGPEVTGKTQRQKLLLTSQDLVYEEIRNRHFSNVFGYLSAKAKDLQQGYDKRHGLNTVGEMKNFVANELKDLKQQHKALTLHIGACEVILNTKTKGDFEEQLRTEHSLLEGTDTKENILFLEDYMGKQAEKRMALRLICLLSLTQDGISSATYKSLKKQYLQSYGFEQLLTFFNLKKLGMLIEQEVPPQLGKMASITTIPGRSRFRNINKKLNLVPKSADTVDLRKPNDMAYVFSGAYTPMMCRLIEQVLMKESFIGCEEVTKNLPTSTFTHFKSKSARDRGPGHGGGDASRIVLVYFIGGCSYTEITALRYLGRQKGYKFIVATTGLINGNSLIDMVSENI